MLKHIREISDRCESVFGKRPEVQMRGKHFRLTLDGKIVTVSASPSDRRHSQQVVSDFRRQMR